MFLFKHFGVKINRLKYLVINGVSSSLSGFHLSLFVIFKPWNIIFVIVVQCISVFFTLIMLLMLRRSWFILLIVLVVFLPMSSRLLWMSNKGWSIPIHFLHCRFFSFTERVRTNHFAYYVFWNHLLEHFSYHLIFEQVRIHLLIDSSKFLINFIIFF
jgi:hypothetical protein